MSGEIEALGDMVAGGLTTRAIEERHGEHHGTGQAVDRGRCLNCGHFLTGPYCDRCGQTSHVHRSVGAFGHDILHSVLHFEGKAWRTLPMLFWRPGELTRRYINGERARFFSPLALFLFAVFLTFGVFSVMGTGLDTNFDAAEAADAQTTYNQARTEIRGAIADTEAKLAAARAEGKSAGEIGELEGELEGQRQAARVFRLDEASEDLSKANRFSFVDVETGIPEIDALTKKANDNPSLMLYKIQGNAYKFAWALIPLSAPFLWLLYPFSRRFAIYDHLVFVTYSISFMLLLAIMLRIAAASGLAGGWIGFIFTFYPPIHMYKQLRGTYRGSRFGALLRTGLLLIFTTIVLTLFLAGLLALGALG
jgi:Protein of unknown function (DUF3667)